MLSSSVVAEMREKISSNAPTMLDTETIFSLHSSSNAILTPLSKEVISLDYSSGIAIDVGHANM